MKKLITLFCLSALITGIVFSAPKGKLSIDKNLAARTVDNFIKLFPDSIIYKDEAKSRRWNYEQGLMLDAIYRVYKLTGDKKYLDYAKKNLDYYVQKDGTILTYRKDEFNIDNVTPGRILLKMYGETNDRKYLKAADTLLAQLKVHPRTKEGSFWHKEIYPNQVWLDGLYMGQPFYAMYSMMSGNEEAFIDITNQFINIYRHAKDPATGLMYHAWDESRAQKWCDKETGLSPNIWGRAMGWYMMALVDVLDYIPQEHPARPQIISILKEVSNSLLKFQDNKTKLWYQIINKQSDKRNYTEASASLMFIYAFAKGANHGYLDKKYLATAKEAYYGVIKNLISFNDSGTFNLNRVCKVSGLGGNPYRDGSLEYYFSEPVRTNDFKGYGPLILASVELVKGIYFAPEKPGKGKTVALDNFYNNEIKEGRRFHYTWQDIAWSGFSELGNIFTQAGASLKTLRAAPTEENLAGADVYIIADPDIPSENPKPNYLEAKEIDAICKWVNEGGALALLANDTLNCEFSHLNKLAGRFGIVFNGDSKNRVIGDKFDMGKFDKLPKRPLFSGVSKLYLKEISTLTLSGGAEPILKSDGNIIMASAKYGKGIVFAVGDPWLYNEYIDNRKLPADFTNYKAAVNLADWLLKNSKRAKK
jgi:unsaturated rhamnogalacturonyl hydrolase